MRLPPYLRMVAGSVTIWILGMPLSWASIALKSFFSSFAMKNLLLWCGDPGRAARYPQRNRFSPPLQ